MSHHARTCRNIHQRQNKKDWGIGWERTGVGNHVKERLDRLSIDLCSSMLHAPVPDHIREQRWVGAEVGVGETEKVGVGENKSHRQQR